MPDWITHILVAWSICTLFGFKFRQFNSENTVLCMVGALIPDIVKISIPLLYFNIYSYYWLAALHTPAGSLVIASVLSLFFKDKRITLMLFILGLSTHYMLDLLLIDMNSGVYLFYPFSWSLWQFGLISNFDINVTIASILLALIVYVLSFKLKKTGLIKSNKA